MTTMISKEYAQGMLNAVLDVFPGGLHVALLHQIPVPENGTIVLDGVEISEADYARQSIPSTAWTVPAEVSNPAVLRTVQDVVFAINMGAENWASVTHAALLSNGVVLAVIGANSPVVIKPGKQLRIPTGALALRMDSV